ncbi:methyl-accepting chemotaxis protein [Gluconacetobacter azotocaptans]|uniref:methyl-accepting chemotaxis protein n=1 Tax=Gluconacetobacter azotocaptans TaxID=142834 RepID=UPI00195C1750|nr:methyl-accepting chemotaxis protein [Gluconacetobacter azotocaptans]
MRSPGIKLSLGIILLLIAVSCIVSGKFSINGLTRVNDRVEKIAHQSLASLKILAAIDNQIRTFRAVEIKQLTTSSPEEFATLSSNSSAISEKIAHAIDAYVPFINSDDDQALFHNLQEEWSEYEEYHDTTFKNWVVAQDKSHALLNEGQQLIELQEKVSGTLTSFMDGSINNAASYALDSGVTYRTTLRRVYAAYVALFVVMVVAVLVVVYNILRPLQKINVSITRLAGGQTDLTFPLAHRGDEIGAISRSLDVFRAAAIAKRKLEQDAELQRRHAEAERVAIQEKAEAEAREWLRKATGALAAGLKRMAGGDLSFQIETEFSKAFEPLRHDFNQSLAQLAATFSQMSGAIHVISDGTHGLAAGADTLARRTETQAAALEQTAAAVAGITRSVGDTAKRSEDAQQIGARARQSAATSTAITNDAEAAMNRIEQGSAQIAAIVDVIDSIAFQTNILALNASVEAARAGTAGRGFAVVATEVRSLAQKSAKAALDVRTVIRQTAADVQEGAGRVKDCSGALRKIASFIGQMGQHLDAIAIAAREQSSSLAEINAAVGSLDQTTQQNTTVADQFHATSRSLADESGRLNGLVRQFSLPETDVAGQHAAFPDHAASGRVLLAAHEE